MSPRFEDTPAVSPALTPSPGPGLWRATGLLWGLVCLAGVAVGLWPQTTFPTRQDVLAAPLPTLGTLAVAQGGFILLIHPLIVLAGGPRGGARGWRLSAAESALCTALAVPFYYAAGYLGDASFADTVRAALAVAFLWPVSWSARAWLSGREGARSAVTGLLVLAALGLPGAFYIAWDFLDLPGATSWLWNAAPATFVWKCAQLRAPSPWPAPAWAAALWPALAAAAAALLAVTRGPGRTSPPRP